MELAPENDGVSWQDFQIALVELGQTRSRDWDAFVDGGWEDLLEDDDWEASKDDEGANQLMTDVGAAPPPPPPPPPGGVPSAAARRGSAAAAAAAPKNGGGHLPGVARALNAGVGRRCQRGSGTNRRRRGHCDFPAVHSYAGGRETPRAPCRTSSGSRPGTCMCTNRSVITGTAHHVHDTARPLDASVPAHTATALHGVKRERPQARVGHESLVGLRARSVRCARDRRDSPTTFWCTFASTFWRATFRSPRRPSERQKTWPSRTPGASTSPSGRSRPASRQSSSRPLRDRARADAGGVRVQ